MRRLSTKVYLFLLSLIGLVALFAYSIRDIQAETMLLTPENTVYLKGEINEQTIKESTDKLIELNNTRGSKTYKIHIVIDSGGGSIIDGMKFIDFANSLDNIDTVCLFCASMAHATAQGINGTRYATPTNIMMAHRAQGQFSGYFNEGEVESRLALFKSLVSSMEAQNAKRIGIKLSKYQRLVRSEWWTYGADSLTQNVVDKIVNLKCSKELINTKKTVTTFNIFEGQKSFEYSYCPLAN